MITNICSSVLTTRMNRNNGLHGNGINVNSCQRLSDSECCLSCKCSNRVLTCIVITILPIAITSTLICVFMTQKTNLHEYAIYTFVVFCVAFVFPFALFFFTVILNKVYNLYKRGNDSSLISGFSHPHNSTNSANNEFISIANNHLCHSPPSLRLSQIRDIEADYYSQRVLPLPPYYFSLDYPDLDERMVVRLSPDNQISIEDNPPSYEMALLCPSVPLNNPLDIVILSDGQLQPPPYNEKI